MKFADSLSVGEIVKWYAQANVTRQPLIAIVLAGYEDGICDLLILETHETVRSVRHKQDDFVQMRNGTMSPGAVETGCWDFRSDKQRKEFWPDFYKKPKAE